MTDARAPKSGRLFFIVTVCLVFAAIAATVLLANDKRHLRFVLDYIGHPEWLQEARPAPTVVRVVKGRRIPAARILIPRHAFTDMKGPADRFSRQIRSDPKMLCEKLRDGGFGEMAWTPSLSGGGFECSGFIDLPATADSETRSSVFTSVKGSAENTVASFRIKLNVENSKDAAAVGVIGSKAVTIFLEQVRWTNSRDVIRDIEAFKDFDIQNFGTRLQFKREFGDTPRYNFLAAQIREPFRPKISDFYFDRSKWFPLPNEDRTPMIEGMMAGENPEGMMLVHDGHDAQ